MRRGQVKKSSKETNISSLKDLIVAVTNFRISNSDAIRALSDFFQAASGKNNSKSANTPSIIRSRPHSQETYEI